VVSGWVPALIFQRLAGEYLAAHPEIVWEWRHTAKRWLHPERLDLIVPPLKEGAVEVWVSLGDGQLVVGAEGEERVSLREDDHRHFEDYGRNITDEALAQEAFGYFVDLLKRHALVAPEP
jgi:hypothetical protein